MSALVKQPSMTMKEETSQIPGQPSFRSTALNAVALVPLLSSSSSSRRTHSEKSFQNLMEGLVRYADSQQYSGEEDHAETTDTEQSVSSSLAAPLMASRTKKRLEERGEVMVLVPHSQLSKPGDWKYDDTPLKSFDWSNGCQRMQVFDGRMGRMAHDRRSGISQPWMDLIPSRGTAAVLGVLNVRDCPDMDAFHRAEAELDAWVDCYCNTHHDTSASLSSTDDEDAASPKQEAPKHILKRMFVFDSFDEEWLERVDFTQSSLGTNLVAFPPSDNGQSTKMMDLHLNVTLNDLAVAIFCQLENRIRANQKKKKKRSSALVRGKNQRDNAATADQPSSNSSSLSIASIGNVINPDQSLFDANSSDTKDLSKDVVEDGGPSSGGFMGIKAAMANAARAIKAQSTLIKGAGGSHQLVTPLDEEISSLTPREADALRRREIGRREKMTADLSLLAGSPIDAYERYTHAAELTKASQDPLWYASSLEGCAASFVAMADAGGHAVDEYLDNNFQFHEEIMTLAAAASMVKTNEDPTRKPFITVDRTKTTLPAAVFALAEEALSIMSRHPLLAPLHSELLLKLASYGAELEDGHLRCRWGEGEGCYRGGEQDGDQHRRRWELSYVHQIDLDELGLGTLPMLHASARLQKFSEFLHRAVSSGGLDDRTRADVATTCARLCLSGIQVSRWEESNLGSDGTPLRLRLPRKAAFFTTVAAEAMSQCMGPDANPRAASLWLAASQLYSRDGNGYDKSISNYTWATLRASNLHALSQQSDAAAAEVAAELFLVLLSEICPDQSGNATILENLEKEDVSTSRHGKDSGMESRMTQESFMSGDTDSVDESISSSRSNSVRGGRKVTAQSRSTFFAQATSSVVFSSQSRWLDDDPVPPVELPLVENGVLISLNSVVPNLDFDTCALAQKRCMTHLTLLRQSMPTQSLSKSLSISPLEVISAAIVKSESHLILDRVKAHGFSGKVAGSSMATFFNPYAKKLAAKQNEKMIQTTLVAEGEERSVLLEFRNRLAVPLEVPSCQLEFNAVGVDHIEAPPLSFTIPAKTKRFAVHFPFIVVASKSRYDSKSTSEDVPASDENLMPSIFEATGLRVACLNRSVVIPLGKRETDGADDKHTSAGDGVVVNRQIPDPAGTYQRSNHNKPKKSEEQISVRLESVPAQPNLLVSFTTSQTPIDESTTVPVHLSDGEIYSIPPFRLENDFGPSGMGRMERLQIVGVGLPGLPEEILYDTDAEAAAREGEEDILSDSEGSESSEDIFEELMNFDGLPPLKMKAITDGVSLQSINDKSRTRGEGRMVSFQIAATHDMGNQLANFGNVRIRFRYRGLSPNPATEIWRKREVILRIVRVKGPRISSLTFRSDLSWGSAYSELCQALAQQKKRSEAIPSNEANKLLSLEASASSTDGLVRSIQSGSGRGLDGDDSLLRRIGMDKGVHVSGDEVVVLIAIANETSSTIVLSNRKGLVGGFEGSPMPTVRVTSGVSVKIPVVIPRIDRMDEKKEIADIAAELIARTALEWKSEVSDDAEGANRHVRQGRVRIPSRCLREIIDEHKSFASRICKPPVSVNVNIGRSETEKEMLIPLGSSIEAHVEVNMQDWVPPEVAANCSLTIEFCCARKGYTLGSDLTLAGRPPYVWCGQVRRTVVGDEQDKTHKVRIAFFHSGTFVVSACVKVRGSAEDMAITEETWWAPLAETVQVEKHISNN